VNALGINGAAGAVGNAVWHAVTIRVRHFPVRIEDLVMAGST
jgi:xanthine dehydrogenase YagR molybdenum-binding subunit